MSARVVAKSRSPSGVVLTTFELEYPRFIHSEFMTHRVFSRNSASSRAIPVTKTIDLISNSPAMPIEWGKNQPGMQASALIGGQAQKTAHALWLSARDSAARHATEMAGLYVHKQVVNRLVEPFVHMKVILTATEYENWYALRNHKDAQPEIRALARAMQVADESVIPTLVATGEWHVPFFDNGVWTPHCDIPLKDALDISASCCAQVSYRKLDDTIEKARAISKRLIESEPMHASPFEHQATPIGMLASMGDTPGITHMDRDGRFWSANFRGWIQHRQILRRSPSIR